MSKSIKIVSTFTAVDNTDEDKLAKLVQYRDENSEDPEFLAVKNTVAPFLKSFATYGATTEKAAAAFTKSVAPLGVAIVEKLAEWVATGKTEEQAARIVRKHFTVAIVTGGVPERTVQRWLSSLEVNGAPVFPRRVHAASTDSATVAVKVAKAVERLVNDKATLSDVVRAWHAAGGKIGRKASLMDALIELGIVADDEAE